MELQEKWVRIQMELSVPYFGAILQGQRGCWA